MQLESGVDQASPAGHGATHAVLPQSNEVILKPAVVQDAHPVWKDVAPTTEPAVPGGHLTGAMAQGLEYVPAGETKHWPKLQ